MKIAYLFSRYPVPSQTFCETEMRALEDCGFELEIYSCSPPATSFRHDAAARPRGKVFYAPPQRGLELGRLSAIERGIWPAALIAEHETRFGANYEPSRRALHAVSFAERLQKRGIDHIHVHFANRATHAALFIRALTGIPFSFTAHAQDFLVDLGSDALLQEMCAQAAFVVTVSDYSRAALVAKCPAAAGKIHRIYNGLAPERWLRPGDCGRNEARTSGGRAAAIRIFSAGRLIDFKGFNDLIAACASLREQGVSFACEIAGEGPARGALEQQIAASDLSACVHLAGLLPQTEIRNRLDGCDVFVLASRPDAQGSSDVLPTVILEAMAASRPVISTRLAGIPEMVVDGETGVLVAPGDARALAEALADLAGAPVLREQYGQAGRARLEDCFSAELASGQLRLLFTAALEGVERPAKGHPSPKIADALVLLLDAWPGSGDCSFPIARLLEAAPRTRVLAFGTGRATSQPPGKDVLSLVPAIEFLPDAMVLEAEWRERAAEAHRIEAWRGSLGTGVDTGDFLLAARRALYLHHRWAMENSPRHIHAVGPSALLCVWLLLQLDPAYQASFLLPTGTSQPLLPLLPNSVIRRVAPAFAAGWLPGAARLATELGHAFYSDELGPRAEAWNVWQNALCRWAV